VTQPPIAGRDTRKSKVEKRWDGTRTRWDGTANKAPRSSRSPHPGPLPSEADGRGEKSWDGTRGSPRSKIRRRRVRSPKSQIRRKRVQGQDGNRRVPGKRSPPVSKKCPCWWWGSFFTKGEKDPRQADDAPTADGRNPVRALFLTGRDTNVGTGHERRPHPDPLPSEADGRGGRVGTGQIGTGHERVGTGPLTRGASVE
jgi:hypothetical protein